MFRSISCSRAAALTVAIAVSATLAGCGTSGVSSAGVPTPTTSARAAADIPAACAALIRVDAVPQPGEGPVEPSADELKQFGRAVLPALKEALAHADASLAASLNVLKPIATAAAEKGTPFAENENVMKAAVGYHAWAHEKCGYHNVDMMAVDYTYENAPTALKAGPVSISMMNHSEKGEFHVALVVKAKDPSLATVDQLLAIPLPELDGAVDIVGSAAAPPGATGGVLLDLKPGTYFVVCPVPVGGDETSEDTHMYHGMASVFEVS